MKTTTTKIRIESDVEPPINKFVEFTKALSAMKPGQNFRAYGQTDVQTVFYAAKKLSPAIKLISRRIKRGGEYLEDLDGRAVRFLVGEVRFENLVATVEWVMSFG